MASMTKYNEITSFRQFKDARSSIMLRKQPSGYILFRLINSIYSTMLNILQQLDIQIAKGTLNY